MFYSSTSAAWSYCAWEESIHNLCVLLDFISMLWEIQNFCQARHFASTKFPKKLLVPNYKLVEIVFSFIFFSINKKHTFSLFIVCECSYEFDWLNQDAGASCLFGFSPPHFLPLPFSYDNTLPFIQDVGVIKQNWLWVLGLCICIWVY